MIKLTVFPSAWDVLNPSPFCMKVEVFLRLAGIDYERIDLSDPRKAPKGKLPIIEDGGKIIPDSAHIIEHLMETRGVTLDDPLTSQQRAQGYALTKMLDEFFYWTIVYNRWQDERGWAQLGPSLFGHMPALLRLFVPGLIRKTVLKQLHAQGMGRHGQDEVYNFSAQCMEVLDSSLGDQDFLFGDHPTSFDAALYSHTANALIAILTPEFKALADKHPRLVAYNARMEARIIGTN